MIEYRLVASSVKPTTIDLTSSKKYNYVRKNITEITNDDGSVMYEYEEAKVSKEVWDDHIMKDLEIAELKAINAKMESDVTDLQNAIVEIYETLLM